MLDHDLQDAAYRIADSTARVAAAETACKAASEHEATIKARLDALHEKRSAISARRQAGQTHAEDGSDLALIAVDGEALEGLARDAAGVTKQHAYALAAARKDLVNGKQLLALVQARATLESEAEHLAALEAETLASVGRLAAAQAATKDYRPIYRPREALYSAITRLHLAPGGRR